MEASYFKVQNVTGQNTVVAQSLLIVHLHIVEE